MFIEELTEYEINQFRFATPIKADGKLVPVRVYCDDKFYEDPRGNSPYILFLRDFSCRISHCRDEHVKQELNKHYIHFMSQLFGKDYENQLQQHIAEQKKNNPELGL